eukprot:scaffold22062_cov101-Isochrysis_galbana.AAC.1
MRTGLGVKGHIKGERYTRKRGRKSEGDRWGWGDPAIRLPTGGSMYHARRICLWLVCCMRHSAVTVHSRHTQAAREGSSRGLASRTGAVELGTALCG